MALLASPDVGIRGPALLAALVERLQLEIYPPAALAQRLFPNTHDRQPRPDPPRT